MDNQARLRNNYKQEFYEKYHKDISPLLVEFEEKRIEEVLKLIGYEILCVAMIALFFWMFIRIEVEAFSGLIIFFQIFMPMFGIVFVVILFCLPYMFNKKFIKNLKKTCMSKVISVFGNMNWLDEGSVISDTALRDSDLFSSYNKRIHRDGFKGQYNGVNYAIAETQMYYESGSGKNRTVWPVFNGVIIRFDANKTIKNKTIITSKKDINIKGRDWGVMVSLIISTVQLASNRDWLIALVFFFVFMGICFYLFNDGQKDDKQEILKEVKLEDPIFNKRYNVYSSDQIEARYLVTTAFMERFKNVQTAFGAKNIKCSFCGDSVIFAIWTNKNLFEIGNLYKKLNNPEQMSAFFNELNSILNFVDYFKLDEHTKL